MNPSSIALPYQLGKAYLTLLLHLLYHLEQLAMVCFVARNDVGRTTEEVVAILHAANERIEFLAAVATTDHDRLPPCFAYGVEELVYEYVQQVVCTLRRAIVNALTQCCGTGGEFVYGKVFHVSYPIKVSALPISSSARKSVSIVLVVKQHTTLCPVSQRER